MHLLLSLRKRIGIVVQEDMNKTFLTYKIKEI